MITFFIGLTILIAGAVIYGGICEKIIKPTNRNTPALEKFDGVDFVPMNKWKNCLIELLNIAGTGPILGPIQGILFGPIAFITIPIGCVIGGAFHDYMSGMISVRNDGEQMPGLIRQYLGRYMYGIYTVFICILMLLVGAVFIYTPGDLFVTQIVGDESTLSNPVTWIAYGAIFTYYIIATMMPINRIIGRIYPIFGAILLLSAIGVFGGLLFGGYHLDEIWERGVSFTNPYGENFIPVFFVTVACGIVSGFHSTQAALIARTIPQEKDGRTTFYNMMILEGFIAMVWAAAAMAMVNGGQATIEMLHNEAVTVVGTVATTMLGSIGGGIAIIGVIVLPITTGDTALRSLRIMAADALRVDTSKRINNLLLALPIFAVVAGILIFAKTDVSGFNILWRYFAWTNECIAVFAFAMIGIYMIRNKMPYIMALVPGGFYMFIVMSYICNAQIGFRLPWVASYIIAAVSAVAYCVVIVRFGKKEVPL